MSHGRRIMGPMSSTAQPHQPSLIFDALLTGEQDPAFHRLTAALGGSPVETAERLIGVPAIRAKRLRFASGGELFLHDGALNSVVLHLVPTAFAPTGLTLGDWIPSLSNEATLHEFKQVFGHEWRFAGGHRYFSLPEGFVLMSVRRRVLGSVLFSADDPRNTNPPETEYCDDCGNLPVSDNDGGLDVDATIAALTAAIADNRLRAEKAWIALADLRALDASGLMELVESQQSCRTCHRVLCLTLAGAAAPTLRYLPMGSAELRPLGPVPPVEQWGDPARIKQELAAMHYVDHEPGRWFLVEQEGRPYLQARYSYSAMIDDSALILLNDAERQGYEEGGHGYLSRLALAIHNSGPYREESPFYARNLFSGPEASEYRAAASAAIFNHTWIAEQRRR